MSKFAPHSLSFKKMNNLQRNQSQCDALVEIIWIVFLASLSQKNIEKIATDTWCIRCPLCALGPYKRPMCHSLITLAASGAENQPQTPGLHCRDADDIEESHMATNLLRFWPTDWRVLFDIQAGSHLLSLLGLASIVCHSLTRNKQIIIVWSITPKCCSFLYHWTYPYNRYRGTTSTKT